MAVWIIFGIAAVGLAVGLYWAASALWVKIISERWDAMCRRDDGD